MAEDRLRLTGFPWKVGVPSYVLPADLLTNVSFLAPRVEAVQLLFFESPSRAGLPHQVPLERLAELQARHGLAYTVHLPVDLPLAADRRPRRQAVAELVELMDFLTPLAPVAFDLHLAYGGEEIELWQQRLDDSLARLAARLGGERKRLVAVENIDYPFAWIEPLLTAHGFSFCLDIGHVLRYGHDWQEGLARLSRARHVHYHGVADGRDHQPITPCQQPAAGSLAAALAAVDYQGVVTMEIYHWQQIAASWPLVRQAWRAGAGE